MSKIGLIAKREFLSRVTKKSFIIGTFLTPIVIGLFGFVVGKIMSYRDDKTTTIAIVDQSGQLKDRLKSTKQLNIVQPTEGVESLKSKIEKKELDYVGVLVVPPLTDLQTKKHNTIFYTDRRMTPELSGDIKDVLVDAIRDYKISSFQLDTAKVAALQTRVSIEPEPLNPATEKKSTSKTVAVTAILSALLGLVMYLAIFIYGSMIMRSVMEEKMNRIVEVMISTVRPFDLMMGKIIGVGGVGFVQFVMWFVLFFVVTTVLQMAFGYEPAAMQTANMAQMQEMQKEAADWSANDVFAELARINWWFIIPVFLFYFLAGYLLYASLFAAVGSAVGDDLGEAQSLTIPISMPVLFAIYIAMSAIQNPDSKLAVFSSYFPLFSPIVMPARLAADPPIWQVLISMAILAVSVWFFVWLAGRIYRVGILMYGKKASFKEIGKWLFYKL